MSVTLQQRIADDIELLLQAKDYPTLRSYFSVYSSEEELVEKVMAWGHLFLPTVFRDTSPEFHYTLIRKLFSKNNEFTACPRGFAKAQSLDSKILTPDGWKKMGELTTDDFVIGADGKKKKILGFSPITEMDLFRLKTRDGRSTLCNLEHLWEVTCPSNTKNKKIIKTTEEILKNFKMERVDKRSGADYEEFRYFIDACAPIKFSEKKLPIDPYTLGVWLGDGTSANGTISSDDPEIFSYIPYKSHKQKAKFRFLVEGLQVKLRVNNLLNNKHIPEVYKFSSVSQRTSLLQGLIDTDGSVFSNGRQFTFCNANKKLFEDVVWLVRSLGGTVTASEQWTRFDKNSELKKSYRFSARIGKTIKPVRLSRKADRWKGSFRTKAAITSIEFEKRGLGRCMKVQDELYITDDFLVTHNTTLNQLAIAFKCAHRMEKFIVVVEKNFTEAAEVIDLPRRIFTDDPFIRTVYGNLVKVSANDTFDERNKDAQGDILINGVRVRAKGFNAPIRGLKSAEFRPTLILIDDVEEDTHILNEEQRKKYRENYAQGIVPAVDVDGCIKVTGTILHHDSLLQNLIDQFDGDVFRAYDPDHKDPQSTLLWPSRWTYERLMDKKSQMEIDGQGSSKFFQEYLNMPVDESMKDFKEEYFQNTYNKEELKLRALNRYITVDVADSKKKKADYTGVTVVDIDSENNWYIRFVKRYKINSAEKIQLLFDLWNQWSPQTIGVEKKAFEDEIKPFLAIKSAQEGVFPHVVELKPGGIAKETRIIGALQGLFENGKIYFADRPVDDTALLKGELRDFPMGKNDDLVDSLAYISQIGRRPFSSGGSVREEPSVWKELLAFRKKKKRSVLSKL